MDTKAIATQLDRLSTLASHAANTICIRRDDRTLISVTSVGYILRPRTYSMILADAPIKPAYRIDGLLNLKHPYGIERDWEELNLGSDEWLLFEFGQCMLQLMLNDHYAQLNTKLDKLIERL